MKPGFTPSKTLSESLEQFEGWNTAKVQQNTVRATEKVQHLKNFGVNKHMDHVAGVMAYTDETPLYGEVNLTMRTKGGHTDNKLKAYGEYIYHLEQAIHACENYVGKVSRWNITNMLQLICYDDILQMICCNQYAVNNMP